MSKLKSFNTLLILLLFTILSTLPNNAVYGASEKKARKKKTVQQVSKKKGKQQSNSQNNRKQKTEQSLSAINKDIEKAKRKVSELELQEKDALKGLARTKKQQLLVREQVGKIKNEVRDLQDTLETIRQNEQSIKNKLNIAKMSYARIAKKYQTLMQKHAPDISMSPDILTGTGNLGELSKISRLPSYLKQMHLKVSMQLKELQSLQGALTSQQELISQHTSRQERLLKESEYEQQNIRNLIAEQKRKLSLVRSTKEEMLKEIEKKEQSAKQLAGLISTMVRSEQSKKEIQQVAKKEQQINNEVKPKKLVIESKKEEDRSQKSMAKSEEKYIPVQESKPARNDNTRVQSNSESFSGGFRWPSSGKRILRGFGQYRNSVTNTVMDNPGLDIACASGSSALCAAPGIVSLVHWLPGYNSMVIVDHGNSYRTVYANLASIAVKKGQSINAGNLIGRTTQSVDGEFLHFEIWKGKQRMNPLTYLR